MSTLDGNLMHLVSRPIGRIMFWEARSLDWNVYVNNLMITFASLHFVFVHIIDLFYIVFKWIVREF